VTSSETSPGKPEESDYDAAPLEPHLIYQGEILVDVPLFHMPLPSRWLLLRTRSGRPVDEALQYGSISGPVKVLDENQTTLAWNEAGDGDFAMGRLSKNPVLVLSQTCDIQTKTFIQVAPILPVPEEAETNERMKQGFIFSNFWLKEHPPEIPRASFAEFELTQAVHKSYIKRVRPEHHFRLRQEHVLQLTRALTRFFGRPNSYDVDSDLAPSDGTYLCLQCFYRHAVAASIHLKKGQNFSYCTKCGGRGWVIQLGNPPV
jgi:hypothetical protein